MIHAVNVKCMHLGWLTTGEDSEKQPKNFLTLVKILNRVSNKEILQTNFVNCLIENYWEVYKDKIMKTQFIPFCIYLASILFWFMFSLRDDEDNSMDVQWSSWPNKQSPAYLCIYFPMIGFITVFMSNQVWIEVRQLVKSSGWVLTKHFDNFWNYNDLVYLLLNTFLMIANVSGRISIEHQRTVAAIASISIWIKLLDWLRLFDRTAFFVALTVSTLRSIGWFLVIMLLWYMTFGTAFYIVNMSRKTDSGQFIDGITGLWILDAFESQYELGLGEFKLE